MTTDMVRVESVYAGYGRGARRVHALQGIDLHVRTGEIFGLLGPNGAGKTTLLAVLEGLHKPTAGAACVGGIDVLRNPQRVKQLIGIQLQQTSLMDDLTVGELLRVYAGMYECFPTAGEIEQRLAEYGLGGLTQFYPRRLSGGQQQRLALALAQVNRPQLVLLDEPTSALDPHARRAVWELIRGMQARGQTVIITTHSMEEAERLCDRVAIVDGGRVIACDTPTQLIAAQALNSLLTIDGDLAHEQALALDGVAHVAAEGDKLTVATQKPLRTLAALGALAARSELQVREFTLRQPNLEDVFLRLTGRTLENKKGDS